MQETLKKYRQEAAQELTNILLYWMDHTIDERGGFIGRIDGNNHKHPDAPKGSVLNSRILWSFSAAYKLTANEAYRATADRACHYLLNHFLDEEYGGVYWTVSATGEPIETKKQIYALSFAVYGLSEYYKAFGDEKAKEVAINLYSTIVEHSYDKEHGGYLEALTRNWQELDDFRLSDKDANERKSMNTHLHLLEAFTNLYRIWPDEALRKKLTELVQLFQNRIISSNTHHLLLFFENDWQPKSKIISYGHDVEAAWLLQEAADILGDQILRLEIKSCAAAVANAAAKGLDADGGLWYEYDPVSHHLVKQKHSWPQAEAMVGFFNTWQATGEKKWLRHSVQSWEFVKKFMKDNHCGEWFWGVNEDYSPMSCEDKVGIWKCPYHNSRACIEIIQRINSLLN